MANTTDRYLAPTLGPAREPQRINERELVVRRLVAAAAQQVFEAWTRADTFRRWWVPESFGLQLVSCELDVRPGGAYRLVFDVGTGAVAFFGTYTDVEPPRRLVWTNEEAGDAATITTLTLEERDGCTLVVVHDLYPSGAALDEALEQGSASALPEQLDQLERLLAGNGGGDDAG